MMTTTDALVKGLNPYDMSLQPRFMNQYGIMYPLFVWPWAKLFGTTILVHRAVTGFFILASCTLMFFVLNRLSVAFLLNCWAVLMLYASLLYPVTSTPTIDPAATGMFFMLMTIFIPWFYKYSNKSLIISILFAILAFYTKLYTFLGAIIMISYLFIFISKRKSLFYGFLLLILMVISILIMNHCCSAYFDNCFFAALNMGKDWSTMERLYLQINMYTQIHLWTLILMGLLILGEIIRFILYRKNNSITITPIGNEIALILYAALCAAFVLYMSLGRHNGAMLWYFFQLLSPFLLVTAAWLFNRLSLWPLVCIPFLIYNLYTITSDEKYTYFDKNILEWDQIAPLIKNYQHILNSPVIAPLLIEQNKDIVDDGQAEYFVPGGARPPWLKKYLKEDNRVWIQQMMFFQNIRLMVENKLYDLIILQPGLLPLGVADDIRKYYKYEGQILLMAPQDRRSYAVTIWKPL